ncbi:uncharacterized protein SEPMUDRAFT_49254, partial [Sphaerulina musiva SO2202]
AKYFNAKYTIIGFKVGDIVLLSTKNLRLKVLTKKFVDKFVGLFKVINIVGKQAYRLALLVGSQIYNVFYVLYLEPYKGRVGNV